MGRTDSELAFCYLLETLRIIMMCEIPSNAVLADQFLEHFHGFSIGSNDMTQLTLTLDRDSGLPQGRQVRGHLRAGPSDHPDLAQWLVEEGIESLSLNPDTVVETWLYLARAAKAGA